MAEFLTLSLVAALMIISPGPDFAIVTKNSLIHGRKAGIQASFGISAANLCHVAINLLGIGVIIAKSVILFTMMKILGASYLIYLGIKGLRTKPAATSSEFNDKKTERAVALQHNGFYSGFLTSLLNPKACLFYLSFFSVILSPSTKISTQIFYGVWLSALAFLWFVVVSLFFTSPVIGRKIQAIKHWLERLTGGILVLLGLKLLSSEMSK